MKYLSIIDKSSFFGRCNQSILVSGYKKRKIELKFDTLLILPTNTTNIIHDQASCFKGELHKFYT